MLKGETVMKNVYDIKYEKCLSFIFPTKCHHDIPCTGRAKHEQTVIILYLYYEDTLPEYFKYLNDIPDDIHVCIISSRQRVLDCVKEYTYKINKKNEEFVLKENLGRDVSALLITANEIIKKY